MRQPWCWHRLAMELVLHDSSGWECQVSSLRAKHDLHLSRNTKMRPLFPLLLVRHQAADGRSGQHVPSSPRCPRPLTLNFQAIAGSPWRILRQQSSVTRISNSSSSTTCIAHGKPSWYPGPDGGRSISHQGPKTGSGLFTLLVARSCAELILPFMCFFPTGFDNFANPTAFGFGGRISIQVQEKTVPVRLSVRVLIGARELCMTVDRQCLWGEGKTCLHTVGKTHFVRALSRDIFGGDADRVFGQWKWWGNSRQGHPKTAWTGSGSGLLVLSGTGLLVEKFPWHLTVVVKVFLKTMSTAYRGLIHWNSTNNVWLVASLVEKILSACKYCLEATW